MAHWVGTHPTKESKNENNHKITNNKSRTEQPILKHHNKSSIGPIRKIKKFVRCSKKRHLSLRTTASVDDSLQILILKGGLPSEELLYIKQHMQYQVRYNDNDRHCFLLASIAKHVHCSFTFKTIAAFTQYMVNHKFIRFRNRGPTQTKHVSLWRIYQFEGEQTLFNAWIIIKAAESALGLKPLSSKNRKTYTHIHHKKKKKVKNYHLHALQSNLNYRQYAIDSLGEDILKHIFSFLQGSKFHCWIHIHEIIDKTHHRSNIIGLEFDSDTRNVHIMQRSPSLLKKVRQIGDKYYTKKNGNNSVVLSQTFFKKSVEMFKAVY